ncbi:MAG: dihydroorotate dehydrogenase [Euryarchaeota archaeon]|nr:dihydroorotate dehydrogenase [Euryarchaeota archaeon]
MLAAGIMGSAASSLRRIMSCGAGAVVTKSIGLLSREGHPGPVLTEVAGGYLNALGLPNMGLAFLDELETLSTDDERKPIIISLFGNCPDDFVELAETFCPYADALELNLSCPHAQGFGVEVGSNPAAVKEITNSVSKHVDIPVWVKLTPNVTDITALGRAAEKGGAAAVVAINTVKGMAIDVEGARPVLGNVFGGLSGSAIKPIAVKCVYDLYNALTIPVIGVGGISNYEDALEFIMAGARAVQIGSAVARNLSVFEDVAVGIDRYLSAKRLSFEDVVGIAHKSY